MPRALIKAPPTKNTLLSMKKQVRFLEQGHDLLERKRELLTRLVYERLKIYRQQRAEAHAALREGYRWLSIAQLRMASAVATALSSRRREATSMPSNSWARSMSSSVSSKPVNAAPVVSKLPSPSRSAATICQ